MTYCEPRIGDVYDINCAAGSAEVRTKLDQSSASGRKRIRSCGVDVNLNVLQVCVDVSSEPRVARIRSPRKWQKHLCEAHTQQYTPKSGEEHVIQIIFFSSL